MRATRLAGAPRELHDIRLIPTSIGVRTDDAGLAWFRPIWPRWGADWLFDGADEEVDPGRQSDQRVAAALLRLFGKSCSFGMSTARVLIDPSSGWTGWAPASRCRSKSPGCIRRDRLAQVAPEPPRIVIRTGSIDGPVPTEQAISWSTAGSKRSKTVSRMRSTDHRRPRLRPSRITLKNNRSLSPWPAKTGARLLQIKRMRRLVGAVDPRFARRTKGEVNQVEEAEGVSTASMPKQASRTN